MKVTVPLGLVFIALAGCASVDPIPGGTRTPGPTRDSAGSSTAASAYPAQDQNTGPRLIIPADRRSPQSERAPDRGLRL